MYILWFLNQMVFYLMFSQSPVDHLSLSIICFFYNTWIPPDMSLEAQIIRLDNRYIRIEDPYD